MARRKMRLDAGPREGLTPAQQLAEHYRIAFSTESGAVVLEDLRRRFGDRRSFVPDSNATAFHEGQRDVYRLCMQMMESDIRRNDPPPQPEPTEEN